MTGPDQGPDSDPRPGAQIEGVRVAEEFRSAGVGQALFQEVFRRARERGCHMVQLTTDLRRPDALRFYERLGFQATHHGMKLHFPAAPEGLRDGEPS